MRAVILAAGKGKRIHSLTRGSPKSLLPLGDTTLLGQSLRHLSDAGVTELVIVIGYRRQEIIEYVEANWHGNVEFVFNPQFDTTNVLYSFWLALPFLDGGDFLFLHADTVFSAEILDRLMAYPAKAKMVFAVDNHPCQDEEMKVRVTDNKVVEVTKQMALDASDGEFLGLARISDSHISGLRRHAESLFEEGVFNAFFELAVQRMINEDGLEVEVVDVSGLPWREVDFPEDYQAARGLFD